MFSCLASPRGGDPHASCLIPEFAMPKRKTKPSSFLMGAVCSCLFPAGGKLWRLKYRFQGKEKLLALGA